MKMLNFLSHSLRDSFKVIVLRGQEELGGPPHHSIIRIIWFYDSSAIFRVFEQEFMAVE